MIFGLISASWYQIVVLIQRFISELTNSMAGLEQSNQTLEARVTERTEIYQLALASLREKHEELQEMNRKLQETQNQLLQSEKMASIGQLAAGVAHEINNPIGFVYSNLGTLDGYLPDIFALIGAYEKLQSAPKSEEVEHLQSVRSWAASCR